MKTMPMILGVLVVGLSPLMAEARNTGGMPAFEMLDRDGTGSLSVEDFQAGLQGMRGAMQDHVIARLMEQADADGRLDEDALRAGFAALHEDQRARREAARDARREVMQARMFDRIDTNNDGVIDAEEYEAFVTRRSERMEQRGPRGPRGHGGHGRRD